MSRAVDGVQKYKEIRDKRLEFKAAKNPLQAPLKLAINSAYGGLGDRFNPLYDPLMMRSVCINGQLLLIDLIDKIEDKCEILNVNTDGIYFKVDSMETLEEIKVLSKEWETRTGLDLEYEIYNRMYQKDVNSYVIVDEKGKYKGKGAFTKDLKDTDYDLPILNFALVNYFVHNIPVEETINNSNVLRDFQRIVKKSNSYDRSLKNCTFSKQPVLNEKTGKTTKKNMWDEGTGEVLEEKVFRVFASTRETDGGIFKQKIGKNPEKYSNSPDKCFIYNGDVIGKETPDYLDRQWYIDRAYERLNLYKGLTKTGKPKKKKH